MSRLLELLGALLEILPEWLRRVWAKNDEGKNKIQEAKIELKAAVLSGDPDRVARARAALTRLQKPAP